MRRSSRGILASIQWGMKWFQSHPPHRGLNSHKQWIPPTTSLQFPFLLPCTHLSSPPTLFSHTSFSLLSCFHWLFSSSFNVLQIFQFRCLRMCLLLLWLASPLPLSSTIYCTHKGGYIPLIQKTDEDLWISLHPSLSSHPDLHLQSTSQRAQSQSV